MTARTFHRSLFVLFVLTSMAAWGCGDDGGSGGNNGANNGGNNVTNNGANNGANNPTNNGANNPTNNGGACSANTVYAGQVYADMTEGSPNGGTPTTTAWPATYDAGVGAAFATVPTSSDDGMNIATGDVTITDATVTSTYYVTANQPVPRANREFWLADGTGTIKVFLTADETDKHPPFNIKVGQKLSLHATEFTNFNGVAEITDVDPTGWALGSEDQEVAIDDRTGGPELTLADVNALVRLTGTISDAGAACGDPYICYALDYGAANTITLRVDNEQVVQGSCVTWVGPVSAFDTVQLNVLNFDWLWVN